MANVRTGATRKHRCQFRSARQRYRTADEVDTAVESVHRAVGQPVRDRASPKSRCLQLSRRHNRKLPAREPCHGLLARTVGLHKVKKLRGTNKPGHISI
jgi:hypothetical protein